MEKYVIDLLSSMNCSRRSIPQLLFFRSVILRPHQSLDPVNSNKLLPQITRLISTSHKLGCSNKPGDGSKKSIESLKTVKLKKNNETVSKTSLNTDAKKKIVSSSSSSSSSSDSDDESGSTKTQNRMHQQLPSSLRTTRHVDEILSILEEPPKVRFGWLKIALTVIVGIYFGAVLARIGASLLEEYEIFVKDDDDDD